jgi:large subunit ribosomal protein L13
MKTLSFTTPSVKPSEVDKKWLVVDAQDMVVGRLASQVAHILRGKHKVNFTPHMDCGDNVIVVNAEKVRFTGNKWSDKVYTRHTGFMGGQRFTTATEMMERDPRRVVEMAVKRMLPKNKLGRQMYRNLRVYAGTEHPHAGLNPTTIELKYK